MESKAETDSVVVAFTTLNKAEGYIILVVLEAIESRADTDSVVVAFRTLNKEEEYIYLCF